MMTLLHDFYLWYLIIIISGIVAAIVRRGKETNKTIELVIIILVINSMIINYQIYQYPIALLAGLILFFITAIVTNYLLRFRRNSSASESE